MNDVGRVELTAVEDECRRLLAVGSAPVGGASGRGRSFARTGLCADVIATQAVFGLS